MATIDFHRLAIAEARTARRWYARISVPLATRFVAALDAAVRVVETNPNGFTPYLRGTRCVRLGRFPYLLVYIALTQDRLLAVAVAHTSRRPGYWRGRLP